MDYANGGVEEQKIFVGGLSWETNKDGLKKHFEEYGEVTDSVVMVDPISKKPRGFGFVTFKDSVNVGTVYLKNHVIDGKKVDPKPAQVKGAPEMGTQHIKKIFVGGLENSTTKEQVKLYFEKFGTVTSVDLKMDKNTLRLRGFGFVEFKDESSVEAVLEKNRFHQINGKMVECKKAEPRPQPQGVVHKQTGGYCQQMPGTPNYMYSHYQYQQQQQQQPPTHQQQQQYYNYCYPPPTPQYGAGTTDHYAAGQQRASSVHGQQLASYGQDATNTYATGPTGYSAGAEAVPYAAANQPNYNYDNTQVPPQTAPYSQYGGTSASNNYSRSMGQGQQAQQQRSFY